MTISGKVIRVPRYEVNLVATYPSDVIQIDSVESVGDVKPIRIRTRNNRRFVNLVTGWPVEFSEDKISFLTVSGEEFVVDRSSIWSIERLESATRFEMKKSRRDITTEFVHPQLYQNCDKHGKTESTIGILAPNRSARSQAKRQLIPQQLLSEPVTIKREFDRLARGHQLIQSYDSKQQFYSVPYLYKNQTSLILWTQSGSRYGSSRFRSNNLTPLVRNELASGPFSYQHEILTGSGPNMESVHDESQTQAYYRFKADYFHLSVMSDLSALLVGGARYVWSADDLADADFRLNDTFRVTFGVDYNAFSLTLIPSAFANSGVKVGNVFVDDALPYSLLQLSARFPEWSLSIAAGSANGNKIGGEIIRANAAYSFARGSELQLSFINRSNRSRSDVDSAVRLVDFQSESQTFTAWYEHTIFDRFPVGGSFSVENFQMNGRALQSGIESSRSALFFKVGVMAGLFF